MPDLPADVQAALDAYLAARVDDAAWERYVNSLGPGVALDVAVVLCDAAQSDHEAAVYLQWLCCEPLDDEAPDAAPLGIDPVSTSYDVLLATIFSSHSAGVSLYLEPGQPQRWPPHAWVADVSGDGWTSEGRVPAAEFEAWLATDPVGEPVGMVWAVALCRALCLAWAPEWARSPEAKGH